MEFEPQQTFWEDFSGHIGQHLSISKNLQNGLVNLFQSLNWKSRNLEIKDKQACRNNISALARFGAFGSDLDLSYAHRAAFEIAASMEIYPASIQKLYDAFAANSLPSLTVPALNMRAVTFVSARGVFQAMKVQKTKAVIFELSRGEIGFTGQRPHEYATCVFCAAIAEGHQGPVFLQGDHFQISAAKFNANPNQEIDAGKSLILEAISAGFYNIDIDTSTLVDLSQPTIYKQQAPNYELSALLADFTRANTPQGITISLGGEVGEVGEENSTPEEVEAYLLGFKNTAKLGQKGLSKISIQSGTRHGGNVLADGSFGEMNVDYDLIDKLTKITREKYGLAGCVQHGASMLSLEKLSRLPKANCIEVHLAAAFLNVVFAHLSPERVLEADNYCRQVHGDEWKNEWSEAQFLHHARRYPIGPKKEKWWNDVATHDEILLGVKKLAMQYFEALNVSHTEVLVDQYAPNSLTPYQPFYSGMKHLQNEVKMHDLAG